MIFELGKKNKEIAEANKIEKRFYGKTPASISFVKLSHFPSFRKRVEVYFDDDILTDIKSDSDFHSEYARLSKVIEYAAYDFFRNIDTVEEGLRNKKDVILYDFKLRMVVSGLTSYDGMYFGQGSVIDKPYTDSIGIILSRKQQPNLGSLVVPSSREDLSC